jgi:cytochrome b561
MTNSPQYVNKHGLVARLLHWLTPLLLAYGFIRNGDVTGALTDPAAMSREIWFGVAVLVIFVPRFVWMHRFNGGASRLPATAPRWERTASRLGHGTLYGAVVAIILTGFSIPLAQSTGNAALVNAASGFHEFITNVGLAVLAVHVAAAVWHKLVRNDGIWESISAPRYVITPFAALHKLGAVLAGRLVPDRFGWYDRIRKFVPMSSR